MNNNGAYQRLCICTCLYIYATKNEALTCGKSREPKVTFDTTCLLIMLIAFINDTFNDAVHQIRLLITLFYSANYKISFIKWTKKSMNPDQLAEAR